MPVTRSVSKSRSSLLGSSTQLSDIKPFEAEYALSASLPTFEDLQDDSPLCGRDAKTLRDATSSAITQVWNDSRATAALLSRKINEGNSALTEQLNESFAAVGKRLDTLPLVAMFQPDAHGFRITPFAGYNEDGAQFSIWLRRLEDIMRMHPTQLSDEQQANFLIGHLEGVAREKVEELSDDARRSYTTIVSHLRSFFEGPQQRYVARQKLSSCRQEPGESCTAFANRLLNLVRAATSGQDLATQKERVLEEFVARLRGDVRYFVKLENPTTFEQAVTKAQTVEQLLHEAAAERLLHPATAPVPVQVASQFRQGRSGNRSSLEAHPREQARTRGYDAAPPAQQPRRAPAGATRVPNFIRCFNCNGQGHFASVCPSPRTPPARRPMTQDAPSWQRRGPPRRLPQANLLSWDLGNRSDPREVTSPEDATASVARLTASLEDSQRQLRNSQARVEALLRRNDELAHTSVDRTPSSSRRAFAGSLPDVRLLLCTVVTLCMLTSPGTALDTWLCPSHQSTTFFLPQHLQDCSGLFPNDSVASQKLFLHLYRPNTKLYSTPASLCKIIRHSVVYSVSFFGVRNEIHKETSLAVSQGECKQMVLHHRCVHGDLVASSGVWRTQHPLTFSFPSAPFGCCVDHEMEVINCYMYDTSVHVRHADSAPQSPVGDLSACAYKDGTCTLADGSLLIWTPDVEEACSYTFVSRLSGQRLGHLWVSDDREFALSWSEQSPEVDDCVKQLTITDQGYAIRVTRRQPRHTREDVGLVTSNQLAAQLLAVEGATYSSVSALYRNAIKVLCNRTNVLATALHTSLLSHPTVTMRALLGREDISATYLGKGYVRVQRCLALPAAELIPFNGTCYAFPRAKIRLPGGSQALTFVNPVTRIVRKHASVVNCADRAPFVFHTKDGLQSFSPVDGTWVPVNPGKVTTLSFWPHLVASQLDPPLTIFHNLVLANLSEVSNDNQLQELWAARDHSHLVSYFEQVIPSSSDSSGTTATTVSSLSSSSILFSFWSFSIYDCWVSLCCFLVTLSLCKSLLKLYLKLFAPALYLRLFGQESAVITHEGTPRPPQLGPAVVQSPRPLELDISQIEIDTANAWPPRASVIPSFVLSVTGPQSFFVTQIPVRANGVHMLALVDTGAGVSIANQSLLPLLGVFKLDPCLVPAAVGMAGIPIRFVGSMVITIQVGSFVLAHTVHFTEADCIPRAADAYNIILGNDFLQRLPHWLLNYKQRVLLIGNDTVPIFAEGPQAITVGDATKDNSFAVRAASTVVLPPASETFVPCRVAEVGSHVGAIVTEGSVIASDNIMVAPAVTRADEPRLLLSNPTENPHVIYKNQHLTSARPAVELANGTLLDPGQWF